MRISLSLISLISFISAGSIAQAAANNTCEELLVAKVDSSNTKAEITDTQTSIGELIEEVEALIDQALEIKLLKKSESKHLKSDLAELKEEKILKESHPTTQFLLSQWRSFISQTKTQLEAYKQLDKKEQKKWKSKMELPLYFATGHFIVFLETNNKSFDYAKMATILKVMNSDAVQTDLKLYLYAFEKQVLRFFSLKEFRLCKA